MFQVKKDKQGEGSSHVGATSRARVNTIEHFQVAAEYYNNFNSKEANKSL